VCLLRGTDWVFNCNSVNSAPHRRSVAKLSYADQVAADIKMATKMKTSWNKKNEKNKIINKLQVVVQQMSIVMCVCVRARARVCVCVCGGDTHKCF